MIILYNLFILKFRIEYLMDCFCRGELCSPV